MPPPLLCCLLVRADANKGLCGLGCTCLSRSHGLILRVYEPRGTADAMALQLGGLPVGLALPICHYGTPALTFKPTPVGPDARDVTAASASAILKISVKMY